MRGRGKVWCSQEKEGGGTERETFDEMLGRKMMKLGRMDSQAGPHPRMRFA